MSGTNQSKVTVTLRNPSNHNDQFAYTIMAYDNQLARDWINALKQLLQSKNLLEKNFCFLGFPKSDRTVEYLCDEVNKAIETINLFNLTDVWQDAGLSPYIIEEWFHPNTVRFPGTYPITLRGRPEIEIGLSPKHEILNRLHNHFELLQGTVWNLSLYYKLADYETKYAIRQLNIICHEMENILLSQRKLAVMPEWVRPSQITTFLHAERHELTDEHRELFVKNGYDRKFGHVYMHWTQIGKTLFEVWRDEHAPKLTVGNDPTDISLNTGATCDAINSLKFYSGEFDIEWGNDVTYNKEKYWWHVDEIDQFYNWLEDNGIDSSNKKLSLGYLPIGEVDLMESFGTVDSFAIWDQLSSHLDIYRIDVDGVSHTFDYCWTDPDYKQQQINMMRHGYDFSSRG